MTKPMRVEKWLAKSRWIPSDQVLARIAEIEGELAISRDYRERQSQAKALAFCCTSVAVSDAEFSAENLSRVIEACLTAKRNGGATELLGRTLLHLARRRLDVMGVGQPVVLAEKKKLVAWQGGCLAIGTSATVVRNKMTLPEREIVKSMNAGVLYAVSLGRDGGRSVALRIVDFVEPMLSTRELSKAEEVAEVGWLDVENGVLLSGAAEALEKGPQLSVVAGRYLVRLFSFASRLTFVACRSNAPIEELRRLPSI